LIPLILASQVSMITGVNHQHPIWCSFFYPGPIAVLWTLVSTLCYLPQSREQSLPFLLADRTVLTGILCLWGNEKYGYIWPSSALLQVPVSPDFMATSCTHTEIATCSPNYVLILQRGPSDGHQHILL
jgi:hypothetical protein